MKLFKIALCLLTTSVIGQEITAQQKLKDKEKLMEMISSIGARIQKEAKKIENASAPELINIAKSTTSYDAQRAASALILLNKPLTPETLDAIFEAASLKMQQGVSESVSWYTLHPVAEEIAARDELMGEVVQRSMNGMTPDSITQGILLDYQSRGIDVKKYLQELMGTPLTDYQLKKGAYLINRLDGKLAPEMPLPTANNALNKAESVGKSVQKEKESSLQDKNFNRKKDSPTERVESSSYTKRTVVFLCTTLVVGLLFFLNKKKVK